MGDYNDREFDVLFGKTPGSTWEMKARTGGKCESRFSPGRSVT